MAFDREGFRGLVAKIVDALRRRLPWTAERHRLLAELTEVRADLARRAKVAAELAAERTPLLVKLVELRADLVRRDQVAATLASERERVLAELVELRADLDRQREAAAALVAECDQAAFDRDVFQAQFHYARDTAEPERDALVAQRDGLEAVVTDTMLDPDRRIAACERFILTNGLEPVVMLLERLRDRSEHREIVGKGLALCRWLGKSGLLEDLDHVPGDASGTGPASGSLRMPLRWQAPSAEKIVLIFKAAGTRFWGNTLVLFQALKPFGQHLVFLTEERPRFFMEGIEGLRAGYDQSCEDLRELCAALGDHPVYCIGSSIGGFGALRYGLDLGAEAVLTFSTWTSLAANVDRPAADEVWTRHSMGANAIDLKPLFAARADIPRLTLYHGALNDRDTRHAQRFADLPGARVTGLEDYADHDSLGHLMAQKKLETVFADFLGQGAVLLRSPSASPTDLAALPPKQT